jgi:hypothetical protein
MNFQKKKNKIKIFLIKNILEKIEIYLKESDILETEIRGKQNK